MLNWEVRRLPGQPAPFLSQADGHDQWLSVGPVASALGEKVLEIALPFQAVGLEVGQEVSLLVTLAQRGAVVAQLPERSMGTFTLQRFELVLPHDKILP
jgi:hypothetical protein